jgi:hypothetical protein
VQQKFDGKSRALALHRSHCLRAIMITIKTFKSPHHVSSLSSKALWSKLAKGEKMEKPSAEMNDSFFFFLPSAARNESHA